MKVIGVDVIRGSVRSRSRRPTYAFVLLADGEIVEESEVTLFRLLRRLTEERPDLLAVDSLQELATDQHELYAFLQMMPTGTRLVQVTGGERTESLAQVAGRYNIRFNRLSPYDEARTIARVAALGAGAEVIAFENASEIAVTRHRSPGRGGWSQNRYVRKIHGNVQRKAREIEAELVASGVRYTKQETRAFGGVSRVVFELPCPRDQVPVATYRGADVQVRITGKRLDRIRFRPLKGKPRYLIVGIDPGTTTAYAALDLDGTILAIRSSRQLTMADLVEELTRVGRPLVIASDVREMPFSVEKIRRAFSAVAYTPKADISVEAKLEATRPYAYGNDHERDALTAALEAARHYRNRFAGVLRRVPPGVDLDEIRAGIVRGQSLEQTMDALRVPAPATKTAPPAPASAEPVGEGDERIRLLEGQNKRLRTLVREFQDESTAKDREIARLEARLKKARARTAATALESAEIAVRDAEIESLRGRLRREEKNVRRLKRRVAQLRRHEEAGLDPTGVPVKVLGAFTRDAVRHLFETLGVKPGDLLYVVKIDGWGRTSVRDLADLRVRALVLNAPSIEAVDPQLVLLCREIDLALVAGAEVDVRLQGQIGRVDADRLTAAEAAWAAGQEEHRRKEQESMIVGVLRDYKTERGKEVRRGG
jgi:predicted RNase H-like nuclease (RuvC/YqgF family)